MAAYLAIDIGASSGRHVLGSVENGKLCLKEIYRFENGFVNVNGTLSWDTEKLFECVLQGLEACKNAGVIPKTVAIDTWGVDYVLLDEGGNGLFPAVSYRDGAAAEAAKQMEGVLSPARLYAKTGIQNQSFNTVYQLYRDKLNGKLAKARHFLMMPDYLAYRLTGRMANEYTNATTTSLVNATGREWDADIIAALGLPKELFLPLSAPTKVLGGFSEAVKQRLGFDCTVVLCPTHDTASAVAACPIDGGGVYISSGTWSLIGTENASPVVTDKARTANFTNEGGIEYRYRFLKNIMGMWLFQSVRKELNKALTYDEMMHLAMQSGFTETTNPNLPQYVAPQSMISEVRASLGKPELPLGDVLNCLYHSLALSYKQAIEEIEEISGKKIEYIFIVGGGSKDAYLNTLTARYTGKRVYTGLTEATATGNIMAQLMADKKISLKEAREIVSHSFEIKEFKGI